MDRTFGNYEINYLQGGHGELLLSADESAHCRLWPAVRAPVPAQHLVACDRPALPRTGQQRVLVARNRGNGSHRKRTADTYVRFELRNDWILGIPASNTFADNTGYICERGLHRQPHLESNH